MLKKSLLVIGSAHMELAMRLSRFPEAGETRKSDGSFTFRPGGSAANGALCAAMLGHDALLCTRLGNDLNGRALKNFYADAGVDTRYVQTDRTRPTALYQTILQDADRQSRSVLFPGALDALNDEDLDAAFSACPDGVLLHFDRDEHFFKSACMLAEKAAIPVFADAVGGKFEYPLSSPKLEAIVLSEAETYAYTDIYPDCLDNYVRACIRLGAKIRSKYFLLRLKGRGTFLTDGKYSEILSLPETADDRAEAPDVFSAVLSAEMLDGKSITSAVRTADAVELFLARNHTRLNPYPTREELCEFCRSAGIPAE